jgi:anaphase-promoting complex subunit 3
MKDINKNSSSTLCVIGNCFSLQRDHKSALKFFLHSTDLNSFFTVNFFFKLKYGYTLAGNLLHYKNK